MKNKIDAAKEKFLHRKKNYIRECDIAEDLIEKMGDMPEKWEVTYEFQKSGFHRLLFIHHVFEDENKEIDPLGSYTRVIDEIESIMKIKLKKVLSKWNYLYADGLYEYVGDDYKCTMTVEVRQFQIDKCEIEYIEKIERIPKAAGYCKEVLSK